MIAPDKEEADPEYHTCIANGLRRLEVAGMISFAEAKWTSAKLAVEILDRYFGS